MILRLFLIVMGVSAPALGAQSFATLSGAVVDSEDAVLPGATVTVSRTPTDGHTVTTDTQGVFRAARLVSGTYEVRTVVDGFAPSVERLTVVPGGQYVIRLTLHVGTYQENVLVRPSEVVGTHDQLRRLPGSVDIVSRDALEASRVFTMNEALRKVPGLTIRDEEGFGLRPNIGIRGINPTRSNKVLLLEDGIPLASAPYGDNASYYHPPIERFERIEVMKGGAQIAYGPQTIAGLVNYVTPTPPAATSAQLTLVAGSRAYFNGHGGVGGTSAGTGYLVDYSRKQGDGSRDFTHSVLNDVNTKLVRRFRSSQVVTARLNYYTENSNVTYSGLREDEHRETPRGNPFQNDQFSIDRLGSSLTHGAVLFRSATLTTNAYLSSFTRDWWRQSSTSSQRPNDASDPACGGMANLLTTCGNEGRLRQYYTWAIEPRIRLQAQMFGLSGETDFGGRWHGELQDRVQMNGATPQARTGVIVESNLRHNQAGSAFVQQRVLLGRWTITPGARVERIRFDRTNRLANVGAGLSGRTYLTVAIPSIGLSHTSGERVTIFGGVHRGFAPPRTEDVITNAGGIVELDPELSWNTEIGARTSLAPGVSIDGTFFRLVYQNQVVPASLAGGVGASLTNGGSTLHQGVEVASRIDSAPVLRSVHNLFARVAYTYAPVATFTGIRFSNIPGFGTASVAGNRLPYAPEHMWSLGIGYAHPRGFDGLVETVGTGTQFGDDLNSVASSADGQRGLLPRYTTWNASVNYRWRGLTVFATVKNLADALFIVDRSRGILPGSPRLVQSGIRIGV